MAAGIFIVDVVATLVLAGSLLYSYGNWLRQHLVVTVAVLLAWYFSFLIVFVLPLDVSSTTYRQCLNETNVNRSEPTVLPPGVLNTTLVAKGMAAANVTMNKVAADRHGDPIITEKDINQTKWGTGSPYAVSLAKQSDGGRDPATILMQVAMEAGSKWPACQQPYSLMEESVFQNLWRVVYWSCQVLTLLILPVMQAFTHSGEFSSLGKLRSALRDNLVYYSTYSVIATILLIYIALKPELHLNWERMKAIASATSNTWGLFVLVLMLGYGLVEVPRNFWNMSQRGYQLNRAYFQVAKLMSESSEAEGELDDLLTSIYVASNMIGQVDVRRPMVETILRKIPLEMMEKIKRRRGSTLDTVDFGSDPATEKTLVKLHRKLIKVLQTKHRTETQWHEWTDYVFELEDISMNMVSNDHRFVHTLSKPPSTAIGRLLFPPRLEWYWKCLASPLLLRMAAFVCTAMSVLVIWSEVTFFSVKPTLSVFSGFVSLAAADQNYLALELICLCTIFYLCLCTYYTVFKIRVLNYYYLAGNHQSDEYTLLFSGALLCRLTPPLCLNFLSLIHMDSHVVKAHFLETSYTRVMGHMDVVPIISDYFNIYFPIALLLLTASTYFSLGARLLSALGFQQFLSQDEDMTMELVEEGKEHIKREKRRRQRLQESHSRRQDFASRFDTSYSSGHDVRHRTGDIVKSRGHHPAAASSSPERTLLTSSGSPSDVAGVFDDGGHDDVVDLSSPLRQSRPFYSDVPRNIFDDV